MVLLLIDLDDTLIDTSKFKEVLFKNLVNTSKVSIDDLLPLYQQTKDEKGFFEPKFFAKKISAKFGIPVGLTRKIICQSMEVITINLPVAEFVKKFIGEKIIFSFGDKIFQQQKINKLGLEKLAKQVIITSYDKGLYLAKHIRDNVLILNHAKYNQAVVLDDKIAIYQSLANTYRWIKLIDSKNI